MPEMVTKAMSFVKDPEDLLELYCGSGTFSIPMRNLFNKIFATENNRMYACLYVMYVCMYVCVYV